MTEGYIDSASTYQVIQLLWYRHPSEAYKWAWQSAIFVSSALINCEHLKMAPSPEFTGAASGPYEKLMLIFSDLITHSQPNKQIQSRALTNTLRWTDRNIGKIQVIFEKLKNDQLNFSKWLDWSITQAWEEHSTRLGGLFNESFIPQIARILDVPINYLRDVHRLSCDLNTVRFFAIQKPVNNDEFKIMSDAYVLSALIRGRYHDHVARESELQILHYPIRQPLLPDLNRTKIQEFHVSNTEQYLSNIILAGAFAEQKYEKRIALWGESILKARKGVYSGIIDLRPKDYDSVAIGQAVNAAKRLDIRTYPKWIETTIDASIAIGSGVLTTFVLKGWERFLATPVEFVLSKKFDVGKSGARILLSTEKRLHDLARSEAGRIEQRWELHQRN